MSFPGPHTCRLSGLERANDESVWAHAMEHGYVILGFAVYWLVYGVTKALAAWGS